MSSFKTRTIYHSLYLHPIGIVEILYYNGYIVGVLEIILYIWLNVVSAFNRSLDHTKYDVNGNRGGGGKYSFFSQFNWKFSPANYNPEQDNVSDYKRNVND